MIDWGQMITDLVAAGLKQKEIAEKVGCEPSLISRLKSGERGEYLSSQYGSKLKALHNYHCRVKPAKQGD